MTGVLTIASKELSDHISSKRFWLFFALIYLAGTVTTQLGIQSLASPGAERGFLMVFTATTGYLPPFLFFVVYLGPLLGVALGFDSVNKELTKVTLHRVLSQPIHRDSVINGKFLAGFTVVAMTILGITGIASGLSMRSGLAPTSDEITRLLIFAMISILYITLWLAMSQLLSVLFKHSSSSLIVGFIIWVVLTFLWTPIIGILGPFAGTDQSLEGMILEQNLLRLSPVTLYTEAVLAILGPRIRFLNPVTVEELQYVIANPLQAAQSILLIWAHIAGLLALIFVCFLFSYLSFMRREIRA